MCPRCFMPMVGNYCPSCGYFGYTPLPRPGDSNGGSGCCIILVGLIGVIGVLTWMVI